MKKQLPSYDAELPSVFGRIIYLHADELEEGRYTVYILYRKKVLARVQFEKLLKQSN